MTSKNSAIQLNAGSMADIAFLMLTFFMMTTVMHEQKGLPLLLPPPNAPAGDIAARNLFTIHINSLDQLLVEGEHEEAITAIRHRVREFVLNHGAASHLSETPQKAVVSLKADRGTSYRTYIAVLDEIQAAYFEIYAKRSGLTPAAFRSLDLADPAQKNIYDQAREGIPMNISVTGTLHPD